MSTEGSKTKRLKTDEEGISNDIDENLQEFLDWCKSVEINIDSSKVRIGKRGTSHNYGMIANRDIKSGEILARIPKKSILEPNTTKINDLIKKNSKSLKSNSNWSKLIVSLMHELTNPGSKWTVYLKLFPNYELFDLVMFWDSCLFKSDERERLLEKTCILRNVNSDIKNMKEEFEKIIIPFLKENKEHFNEKCFDFDYYKKIAGFIMAYSFRDPNEDPEDSKSIGPMMVPVADILNHIAKNNAQINFEEKELVISSIKSIKKDEEVYNTYGNHSNTDLLHMYGFVEKYPENVHDAVEVPVKYLIETIKNQKNDPLEIIEKKIETLFEIDLIDTNACFFIGPDGILNEEECLHMLQIYSMAPSEFREFVENDCELLEDEEWDNYSLLNEKIKNLPPDWKTILTESCEMYLSDLKEFTESLEKDESLKITDQPSKKEYRIINSKTIYEGHINILDNLIKSIKI